MIFSFEEIVIKNGIGNLVFVIGLKFKDSFDIFFVNIIIVVSVFGDVMEFDSVILIV